MTTDTLLAQPAGKVFASNPDLCKHTQSHHVKICHLCCRIFVSDDKLFDHMKETHPGSTGRTREELIEGERAGARAVQKWFSETQKKEKKKRRKYKDDDEDEDDGDDTYHLSQDYNDSKVDPEFRPTKRELKKADKEGDS